MKKFAILAVGCLSALSSTAAFAGPSNATFAYSSSAVPVDLLINGSIVVDASAAGWISLADGNNGGAGNYIAGVCGSSDACNGDNASFNDYFTFDLSSIGNVTSAVLQLPQPSDGYISTAPSLTYTTWDTSDSASQITSDTSSALYYDLQSGTSYGSVIVDAATDGTTVDLAFNSAGIGALNAAAGGSFAFGGTVSSATAVPEPATWAMMLIGLGAVGFMARRRQALSPIGA